MTQDEPHEPVLLREVLEAFAPVKLCVAVDGTLGAGGHSRALLSAHPEVECLVGIDQDPEARRLAVSRLSSWEGSVVVVSGNFGDLGEHLDRLGVEEIDGILLDLGVSSMQLDLPSKGFSFMRDGPLDMRMDPSQELTAAVVINEYSQEE